MKRIFYIALLVMTAAGTASAQQWGPGCGRWGPDPKHGTRRGYQHRPYSGPGPGHYREDPGDNIRETVTAAGNLELIDGTIALRQDGIVYYIIGLNRLIGFIDGLKEGAAVTLEGTARPLPGDGERRFLLVSKLEINGKTYDNLNPAFTDRRERSRSDFGRRRDSPGNPRRFRDSEQDSGER